MDIISRAQWGARHDNGFADRPMPIREVWLHHSVTIAPDVLPPFDDDDRAIRTLETIGEQRFGGGISYTWPITPVGRVYEGHSPHRRGAHTGGHNTTGAAICFVGDYSRRPPTTAQIEAAAQLLAQEFRAGRIVRPAIDGGHRDTKSTGCPGDAAYAAIPTINARAAAILAGHTEEDTLDADDRTFISNELARIRNQLASWTKGQTGVVVGRIAGLEEAVRQLGAGQGAVIDLDAIRAASEEGARAGVGDALDSVDADVTVRLGGSTP